MARKEVEVCDMCETLIAVYEVSEGKDKGLVLCDDCVEFWIQDGIQDVLEKTEEKLRNSLKVIKG